MKITRDQRSRNNPKPNDSSNRTGAGRKPGVPNKITAESRELFKALFDANYPKLQKWLDLIETQEGPLMAFRCVMELAEYCVPKLARVEHTGKDGGAIVVQAAPLDEQI